MNDIYSRSGWHDIRHSLPPVGSKVEVEIGEDPETEIGCFMGIMHVKFPMDDPKMRTFKHPHTQAQLWVRCWRFAQ